MTSALPHSGMQLRSTITSRGELELTLVDEPVIAPAADEVLIRVEATPINPSDQGLLFGAADLSTLSVEGTALRPVARAKIPERAMRAMAGRLDQPMTVGNEGAGVVIAAGDAPGDAGPDSGEDEAAPRANPAPEAETVRAAFEGRSLYDAVVSEVRRQLGEDGLAFLKEVREMVRDIGRLLETAKGQAAIRRPDKDTEKALEETDEARKELNALMDDMEGEIRRDAPTAGMRLSIAA